MHRYNWEDWDDWRSDERETPATRWGWLIDLIVVLLLIMSVISTVL